MRTETEMFKVKKNIVVISRKKWEKLKKDDYFKDLIEVLEDSEGLEKAKRETTSFINLRDYIKKREKKENNSRKSIRKKRSKKMHV